MTGKKERKKQKTKKERKKERTIRFQCEYWFYWYQDILLNPPQCWRTSRVCHNRFACHTDIIWRHDVILWCQLASRRHSVTSHDVMTSHHRPRYFVRSLICIRSFKIEKPGKSRFWPSDLDHRTWPRFHQGQSLYQVPCPNVKWFGSESADWQTDGQKQGTDSITSTIRFYYLNHWRRR